MCCNMIRFIAFYFVLRIGFRGMVRIALVIEIRCMHFYDRAGNLPRFGVPAYFVSDFKFCAHNFIG